MRSINNSLLLMATAGLVGWYVATSIITAINHQLAQVLGMLN